MTDFPTWLYHKDEPARLVNNEDEKKGLGTGWRDRPFEKKDERPDVAATAKAMVGLEKERQDLEKEVAELRSQKADAQAERDSVHAEIRLARETVKDIGDRGDVRSGYVPIDQALEKTVGTVRRPAPDDPLPNQGGRVMPAAEQNPTTLRGEAMPPVFGDQNFAKLPIEGPREEPTPSISTQVAAEHGLPTPSAKQVEQTPVKTDVHSGAAAAVVAKNGPVDTKRGK